MNQMQSFDYALDGDVAIYCCGFQDLYSGFSPSFRTSTYKSDQGLFLCPVVQCPSKIVTKSI